MLRRQRTPASLPLTGLLLAALILAGASPLEAQHLQTAEVDLSYAPSGGQDGVEADIQVAIRYRVRGQAPQRYVEAKIRKGDFAVIDGKRVTAADVGPAAWKAIGIRSLELSADIYSGNHRVSTVRYPRVLPTDVPAILEWSEVFPGVSAESARKLFEDGFSIRNVRVTGVQVDGVYAVRNALRDRAAEQERAAAAQQNAAGARAQNGAATASPTRSSAAPTAAAPARAGQGAQQPTSTAPTGLSIREQRAYDSAIASAREHERAGNLIVAIEHYKHAYGISPEPWIESKVQELVDRRGAEMSGSGLANVQGLMGGVPTKGADEKYLLIGSQQLDMLSRMELSEDDQKTLERLQKASTIFDMMAQNATSLEDVEALGKLEGVTQAVIIGASLFGGGDDDEEEAAPAPLNASQKQARQVLLGLQEEVKTAYARYAEEAQAPSDLAGVEQALGRYQQYERQSAPARLLLLLWYQSQRAPDEATLVAWRQQIASLQESKGIEGVIAAVDQVPGVPGRYRDNLPFLLNAEDAFGERTTRLERRRAALADPQAEARAAEAALASGDPSVMYEHLRRFDSPRADEIRQRLDAFRRIDSGISSATYRIEDLERRNKVGKWVGLPAAGLLTLIGFAVGPTEYPWITAAGVGSSAIFIYTLRRNGNTIESSRLEIERLQREREELVRSTKP